MKKLTHIFEELLVLEAQGGDRKAFSLLVERLHPVLCNRATWYLKDPQASQDVVQESWKTIYLKIGTLREPEKFTSWALKIVSRKCLNRLKAEKRYREFRESYAYPADSDAESGIPQAQLADLHKAIKRLSRVQQEALRLFYTEAYSLSEISYLLDVSEGTVKSRIFNARKKLRKILNQQT
ncbi:RNA polymerase sigma factor [Robiginitalea sp. SC105]|uniref:RNA polymerase sigma factor n=1 Tax=Robiginitalea sp. SC105 TaxID=2762332 RepID=UPI00163B4A07|nr:RNA polymerase sigma factor [Robiginitalea sp. SC105]MBC2840799.1 RNA polymerase sigma factor [Robiginitalea sp. SC105]